MNLIPSRSRRRRQHFPTSTVQGLRQRQQGSETDLGGVFQKFLKQLIDLNAAPSLIRMFTLLTTVLTSESVRRTIAAGLERVERKFHDELATSIEPVAELCRHVERYRGKMLRPTLVLLSGLAAAPERLPGEEHVTAAAVLEMIHMATLVHDDVLDEADVRRGGDTVNKRCGNEAAVILGDYLISKSFHLCSSLDDQRIAMRVGEITSIVCEGELMQVSRRGDLSLDERAYFEIIRRKTASLIALASELGARLAGAEDRACRALSEFGEKIGMAFQIQDDLLDVVGEEEIVGKSLGKDLEKGKLTLPLIRHLAGLTGGERERFVDLVRSGTALNGRRASLAEAMRRSGAVSEAQRSAERLVAEAKEQLLALPESGARESLESMADAVITRSS